MKILIAYDGSDCARAALDDLSSAGLPATATVKVVAVLESWLPPPSALEVMEEVSHEMEEKALAQEAAVQLRSAFPGWDVSPEIAIGSPGTALLTYADQWHPDLLVVGSHGRSALGRFFLGSVSQKLVNEAHCSVRVARGRVQEPDTPIRLLVGVDGSAGANAAIEAIAARTWPAATEIKVVNASWSLPPIGTERSAAALIEWEREEHRRATNAQEAALAKLTAAGLVVSTLIKEEDPKKLLCDEAERWGADCIFLGAKGISTIERMLIGSVSAGVAARAHCSVEIVRPKRD